ncbi:hypothetical protein GJ698_01970 [Pseudoduganella sp. FT26W]|uniref:Alginate biosynthesis protein AlgF n=1 Tax=Duganella aquatilis TaxID=2666082 RepID=A0A844CQ64_9BURK|nr:alginate O-acetyltransferase AlgF [Duganella aquatilis]MRW82857.1 hypothetical protein [Duganella aquatilis]
MPTFFKFKPLWLALAACAATPLAAQEIARLYAARAPAGSAYVRVVTETDRPLRVTFGGKQEALDGQRRPASDYRIIDARAPMAVKADGRELPVLPIAAGSFNTVIIGPGKAVLLADATDTRDDLKAELRFYNLVAGCDAALALKNGPTVFERVAYRGSARRNINPVKAALRAGCASAPDGATATLPALKSGDHVSLFLLGDAARPRLHVQVDATENAAAGR